VGGLKKKTERERKATEKKLEEGQEIEKRGTPSGKSGGESIERCQEPRYPKKGKGKSRPTKTIWGRKAGGDSRGEPGGKDFIDVIRKVWRRSTEISKNYRPKKCFGQKHPKRVWKEETKEKTSEGLRKKEGLRRPEGEKVRTKLLTDARRGSRTSRGGTSKGFEKKREN